MKARQWIPTVDAIDRPSDVTEQDMAELLSVDKAGWLKELELVREHYAKFGERFPSELKTELASLEARLSK